MTIEGRKILMRLRFEARKYGMTEVSRRSEIAREHLYEILHANGNPTLDTLIKLVDAVGMSLELREPNSSLPKELL